jgi:hypothetical protein
VALGAGVGDAVGLATGVGVGDGTGVGVATGVGLGVGEGVGVGEAEGTITERETAFPLTKRLVGLAGGAPLKVNPTVTDPPAGMEAFQEAGAI